MKRLISLLMAICLMVTICVPGVSAAEATDGAASALDSRITVAQGVRPMVSWIELTPVLHSGTSNITATGVYNRYYFQATSTARGIQLSPAETQELVNEFKEKNGNEPNAWRVRVRYDFVDDGKGSYGKYFEWTPSGDLYKPQVNANGKVRVTVSRFDTSYIGEEYYNMPEDSSKRYLFGLAGGFWYYCAPAGRELNIQSGYGVVLNDTK